MKEDLFTKMTVLHLRFIVKPASCMCWRPVNLANAGSAEECGPMHELYCKQPCMMCRFHCARSLCLLQMKALVQNQGNEHPLRWILGWHCCTWNKHFQCNKYQGWFWAASRSFQPLSRCCMNSSQALSLLKFATPHMAKCTWHQAKSLPEW